MRTTRGMRRRPALSMHAHGVVRDVRRPLALRWRRGKAHRERARARHVAPGAHVTCVSHVHVHVALAARAGQIGSARASVPRAALDATRRRTTAGQIMKARGAPTGVQTGETEGRTPARVMASVGQRCMPVRTELRHVAARPPAMRSETVRARHAGGVPRAWRVERVRVADGRAITTVEQRALRRTSAGATQLHVARTGALAAAPHRPNAGKVSMPNLRTRQLDLAWRAPTRVHVADASTEKVATPSSPRIHAEHDAVSAASQSSVAAPVPLQPRVLEYSQFAPALVDRLADDVLRRVERRVRIERERRGI